VDDEIGDNFNVGWRSSAIMGVDFEVAGFYQLFKDFQFGESFSSPGGDREFGEAYEVTISGVELAARVNSQPFTGGPLNFFAEGNYTYARSVMDKAFTYEADGSIDDDFSGNRLPEVPWHVAALTLGVEGTTGWRWNASATWTYRGAFFTDANNTPYGVYEADCSGAGPFDCEIEEAGEVGGVPSVWLLSARFNLDIGNTGGLGFNYGSAPEIEIDELHGLSAFARDGATVFHTYSAFDRGTDALNTVWQLLERAPLGRGGEHPDWPRRRYEYA
jgi:Fe(3+) dicitrate transport protein